jgi:hypothetical protein
MPTFPPPDTPRETFPLLSFLSHFVSLKNNTIYYIFLKLYLTICSIAVIFLIKNPFLAAYLKQSGSLINHQRQRPPSLYISLSLSIYIYIHSLLTFHQYHKHKYWEPSLSLSKLIIFFLQKWCRLWTQRTQAGGCLHWEHSQLFLTPKTFWMVMFCLLSLWRLCPLRFSHGPLRLGVLHGKTAGTKEVPFPSPDLGVFQSSGAYSR